MDVDNQESKKRILFSISLVILLLLVSSIILGINNIKLRNQINTLLQEKADELETSDDDIASGSYSYSELDITGNDLDDDSQIDNNDGIRKVYLTFDDGPSGNTERILDILNKYDVKATFFVVGKGDKYIPLYQRIVDEGHTIGMHSYSHKYSDIYVSIDAFSADLSKLQEFIYENTGVWSRLYRFPGGSSNEVSSIPIADMIEYLNDQGIVYFDWNIASGDAIEGGISKEAIIANCMSSIEKYDECVILLHDLSDKNSTVDAIDELIPMILQLEDTQILAITDETIPVQHVPALDYK